MNDTSTVVTGMGIVSCFGNEVQEFFDALTDGQSGAHRLDKVEDDGPYPLEDLESANKIGGPVLNFNSDRYLSKKQAKRSTRSTLFGVHAGWRALEDAGYTLNVDEENDRAYVDGLDPERGAVSMGTNFGGMESVEYNHERFVEHGPRRVSPFTIPQLMANRSSGELSIVFGLEGYSATSVSACASTVHAVATGQMLIEDDRADMVLAGGTEAVLTPFILAAFSRIQATTRRNDEPKKASRPFDADRDGFLPGEGAGVLVLESKEQADSRGATPYAELQGTGMTDDAHHITEPQPEGTGAAQAMNEALETADLDPEDVDYVNAHGTSTPMNDKMETQAIKSVFGDYAHDLSISSTKSQTGHLGGAAGAIEAVASIKAIQENEIPPTINYETPDPECDLNYTPNEPEQREVGVAISNSFGFGGHNGTLCFTELD
jgi:3-oxoacyl-[acyl-carrier-protein] synthase II